VRRFTVTRHAARWWETTGDLPKWHGKGLEAYSCFYRTKRQAEASASRWNRHVVKWLADEAAERATRERIAREYLVKRAARPKQLQMDMFS
jgi:hypothetical protein